MKPTKARTYWDEASWPWQAAAILVVLDIAGLAVSRYLVSGGAGPMKSIVGDWAIVTRILLALTFAAYFYGRGVPARAFGLTMAGFRRRMREFWTCLAVVVPLAIALSLMAILILRAGGARDQIAPPLKFEDAERRVAWIWVFVVALPPMEELLYRGILHPALRGRLGVGWAVAAGGLIFGLIHWFYGIDIASLPAYAAGGAALAWVYERTGSLFFPWLLHVVTNLAAVWVSSYPGLFEALRK
ncbi:MAG TPA: type II CAAX endopeptidase family protein [Planctomycetota bacterium]|nr:type II CAAX endopeptidase family protein [Planctomycetota bacterium]